MKKKLLSDCEDLTADMLAEIESLAPVNGNQAVTFTPQQFAYITACRNAGIGWTPITLALRDRWPDMKNYRGQYHGPNVIRREYEAQAGA